MRISVILVTARPGGIDILLTGLSGQEFDHHEFETVVVDALYPYRRERVADEFATRRLVVRHVPPRERIWPVDACPQARNTGLAKASGELVVWLTDYSYLPPLALVEHWGVYEYFNKKKTGMAAHRYLFPPSLAYPTPDYAPVKAIEPNRREGVTYEYVSSDSDAFVRDIESGFYDPYMYSVFQEPLETPDAIHALKEDLFFYRVDPKRSGKVGGIVDGNFWHAKAESIPLEWALSVNGFDELYTGHCYDDTDFGHRVTHYGGMWCLLHEAAMVDIVNPRHLFPHLIRRTDPGDQLELYQSRKEDTALIWAANGYDLRVVRATAPWWY